MKNCPTKVAVAFTLLAGSMAAGLSAVPTPTERPEHSCSAGCNHHAEPNGIQCADLPAGLPISMCFTEDADPAFVAEVTQRLINVWLNGGMDGGLAYQLAPRWNLNGSSAQGQPLQIRWSVVPDGVTIPDEIGLGIGSAPNNVNATLAARFGSLENGKNLIRQVFQRWSDLTGLSYVEVSDDGAAWGSAGGTTRGDVRIAGRGLTNTSILAYNQFPNNGDMVLNSDAGWGPTTNNYRYFRNIVAHEHGHGIGLEHVCPAATTKLMEPFIFTNVDGPQIDDIRAGQRQYGDNLEAASDALGNAAIPTNATGSSSYTALSIDDNADIDLWKIAASQGMKVSMIVNPSGGTYTSGPQTSACNTGTSITASSIHDLKIDVLGSSGTVLFTQNANASGLGETLSNYEFASAGTYYLRIAPVTTTNDIQLYNATLTITPPPSNPADVDGNGIVDAADLGVLLAAWGSSLAIADINDDGIVDGNDLGLLLSSWGQ
ncbi:MAG: matrixin family metalloprotease [Bacteroidia bacterium]|nr:matrixin family metalloprotease [Bacteroidia bacterium]